jgi:uncharacterized membrane protein YkvA (DUF1232 family)
MSNSTPSLPGPSQGNIIRQTILRLRLLWRLFRDPRVPWWVKIIPVAGVIYLISPLDFLVDWVPPIGQLDDAGILLTSFWLFQELCPQDVVKEHWDDLTTVTVKGTWKEEKQETGPEPEKITAKVKPAAKKPE